MFKKISPNFVKSPLKFCLISQILVHSLWHVCKSPQCFEPSLESIGLLVQKKQKIDIQDGRHGGHLGFLIRAIFYLQVTPMLPIKF